MPAYQLSNKAAALGWRLSLLHITVCPPLILWFFDFLLVFFMFDLHSAPVTTFPNIPSYLLLAFFIVWFSLSPCFHMTAFSQSFGIEVEGIWEYLTWVPADFFKKYSGSYPIRQTPPVHLFSRGYANTRF